MTAKRKQRRKQYRVTGFARQGKGHGWAVNGRSVRQMLDKDTKEQYDAYQ